MLRGPNGFIPLSVSGIVEVELKVALPSDRVDSLRERLVAEGTRHRGPVVEEDVFFDHPSREMVTLDQAFRLRRAGKRMELTFKGARVKGNLKSRPEHNVGVDRDPTAMLESLGFFPAATLRKTRESWRMGDVEVTIDHIDGVGHFAEIEALVGGDEAGPAVEAAAADLGLLDLSPVSDSYLEIALDADVDDAQLL